MSPAVELSVEEGIAVITLNRPDNRNSMTPELLECFSSVVAAVCDNELIRVVVITGRGTCFSAGADFNSTVTMGTAGDLAHERSFAMYRPFLRVLDIPVPVIGALNGHAVGGGFGLSLLCDIRIANRKSKYGANFSRLGLHPGMGISYVLPRLVGLSTANEMLFTGRLILGEEAKSIGLVSSTSDSGREVIQCAMAMATTIASNAPVAVRLTKQSIREHLDWDIARGARQEAFAQAETLGMEDAAEGMSALLEKREPVFIGR